MESCLLEAAEVAQGGGEDVVPEEVIAETLQRLPAPDHHLLEPTEAEQGEDRVVGAVGAHAMPLIAQIAGRRVAQGQRQLMPALAQLVETQEALHLTPQHPIPDPGHQSGKILHLSAEPALPDALHDRQEALADLPLRVAGGSDRLGWVARVAWGTRC